MKPLSLKTKLDRFPPVAVRLLARVRQPSGRVVAMTDQEIAAGSGLTVPEVVRLSQLTSWDSVPVSTLEKFSKGCGFDFDSRDCLRSNSAYMKRLKGAPLYLRRSAEWESKYQPLIAKWLSSEGGRN